MPSPSVSPLVILPENEIQRSASLPIFRTDPNPVSWDSLAERADFSASRLDSDSDSGNNEDYFLGTLSGGDQDEDEDEDEDELVGLAESFARHVSARSDLFSPLPENISDSHLSSQDNISAAAADTASSSIFCESNPDYISGEDENHDYSNINANPQVLQQMVGYDNSKKRKYEYKNVSFFSSNIVEIETMKSEKMIKLGGHI